VTLNAVSSNADCGDLDNTALVSATNEAESANDDNQSSHTITVDCPNLQIVKTADADTISAGDEAAYTIVVTNHGPGAATNVHLDEQLPSGVDWSVSVHGAVTQGGCASSDSSTDPQSITCDFASLAAGASVTIHLSGKTDAADCGTLHNVATVSGDNEDQAQLDDNADAADVTVLCPGINIAKSNDQAGSVLPGTNVSYTLMVTLTEGTAHDVVVVDTLPDGLDAPTGISDDGVWNAVARTITWELGDLDAQDSPMSLHYQARVSADVESGAQLRNVAVVFSPNSQCPDAETMGPECTDASTVTPRVPGLIIDKAADTEQVDVSAGKDTTVTWTLSYALTDGPVTNVVISDPLPAGLEYVDGSASHDGAYDAASRTLTWSFASLSEDGSVSFQTTVAASMDGGTTIENVATIDSDETAPDNGQDSVRTVEQEEQAATGTPEPSVPNTALGTTGTGQPLNLPIELVLLVFAASLGGLAVGNLKAVRRRR
jgi:uncharacterized repeat protein (TIGR01451 family)/fimbrial isopeptide formation D2 family protein